MMSRQVVVIAVEGLGTQLLSPYGNSWAGTTSIGRLATESIVFDNYWLNALRQAEIYRQLIAPCNGNASTLAHWCEAPELRAKWLTDVAHQNTDELIAPIQWQRHVPKLDRGEEILDSSIGQIFEHVLKWFSTASEEAPELLWLHSGGLTHSWDSPMELRESFCEEDDPSPPDEKEPPEFTVNDTDDLDRVTGWTQAAAAQLTLLDQCIGAVDVAIEERGWQESCLLIIMGVGGYSFGEHNYVGWKERQLWSETIQAPLILRPGKQVPITLHRPEIFQPDQLLPTIRAWLSGKLLTDALKEGQTPNGFLDDSGPQLPQYWPPLRSIAIAKHDSQWLVRTPQWLFRQMTEDEPWQIYMQPDDRWCVNDIASRVAEVRDAWTSYWPLLLEHWQKPFNTPIPPLPDELVQRNY
jgi:hypothetical protein